MRISGWSSDVCSSDLMTRSPWPQAPACCTSRPPNCSPTHTSSACSWAPLRLSVLFGGILLSEVAQYHLDHIFPTLCMRFGRLRVALENQRKRVLIGHIEKAQRADRGVDIDRIQTRTE